MIDLNLAHYKKCVFCKLFFHFPLMKVEGSTETLGLLKTLYIFLYNFKQSNVLIS